MNDDIYLKSMAKCIVLFWTRPFALVDYVQQELRGKA